ncbi:histone-lysine N-methyltransferase SETMAR [Trichonephila clavipes]|uniref:Histone-lysine N-methyltransferase SETMAR n=1 Tax=Trichonephila clavipes TaxID=2585209 RepID=A0A8X6VU67_TRICX|nr:histone-lysine N-methyltransferase SETMAR [Trichonephila clavipes]
MSNVRDDRSMFDRLGMCRHRADHGGRQTLDATGVREGSCIEKRNVHRILRNEQHDRTETSIRGVTTFLITEEAEKVRQYPSPVKLMVIVTYDFKGVIVCYFVSHVRTVTAQYYRDFMVPHVRRDIRDKRLDLVYSAIILHDNARPHNAKCVRQLLWRWRWEELEYPPYSSKISPCDFDLIPKIKELIRGRRFETREDITNAMRQHVTRFPHGAANAMADGIQHLPHRWQCVATVAGDYIESL